MTINKKNQAHVRRKIRIRKKLQTGKSPYIAKIFRSNVHNYVQLLDTRDGKIITGTSDLKIMKGTKQEKAKQIGLELAKRAQEKKIDNIVFDRSGYKYHGRVKQIAEGLREGGLQF